MSDQHPGAAFPWEHPVAGYPDASVYQGPDTPLKASRARKTAKGDREEKRSERSVSPTRGKEAGHSSPFPSMAGKADEASDAGSSQEESTQVGSPGSPEFFVDPDQPMLLSTYGLSCATYDPSSATTTPFPATPFVPVAMTPSPFVNCGGTFSQMLMAASMDCSLSMPATPADFSVPATPQNFYGQTPYPGDTPSPNKGSTFANLLRAEAAAFPSVAATPSVIYGATPYPGDSPSPKNKKGGTFAHLLRAEARAAGVVFKPEAA
jgi:hypothetical protein